MEAVRRGRHGRLMPYRLLADMTLLLHLGFVLFVVGGAGLVFRRRRLAWLHLPAVAWGVAIELTGWVCPLTHLENRWRRLAGEGGYAGGFVEQYLEPLLYPAGLTLQNQRLIALAVLLINLLLYGAMLLRRWRTRRPDC